MTNKIRRAVTRTIASGALLFISAACTNKFVDVTNPNLIDASTVDPTAGAVLLANSAQQNYAAAYGWLNMYSAWFSGEADIADTFPTRNEFGFRQIADVNGSLASDVWGVISLAVASTKIVLDLTLPTPTSNISIARAATFRGFAVLQMATDFCAGDISSGPKLTTAQLLDTATFWFNQGRSVGLANASADGVNLANASALGLARARLQTGDLAGATTAAALVPAGFVFNLAYLQDLNNQNRIENKIWQFTFDRSSISVPAGYQNGDSRVPFLTPAQTALRGQDALPLGFFPQNKFTAYGSPVRLASRLEADYIAAEASANAATQLALIATRRAAAGQAAYAGATDANSVLTELLYQYGQDFYLEGRKLAAYRRHPANIKNILPAGAVYLKPGYASVGTQTCYPVPYGEYSTNSNYGAP
jgi:starch-binding outer membrane protein, SusD/RagB family